MKRKVILFMSVMVVVLTVVSQGALVTPVGAKQSSAYSAARAAGMLGNAAGMDATETYLYNQFNNNGIWSPGETASADNKEWCSRSESFSLTVCQEQRLWAVVDLGAVYDLSTIKIWNFQWQNSTTSDLSVRGISQFDIYVRNSVADTDDGTAGGTAINLSHVGPIIMTSAAVFNLGTSNPWQQVLSDQALAQAPNNDTYTGQSFSLTGKTGRFVAIVADSAYSYTGGAGLGKVRFDGVEVPEPATIGILLIGGLMGLHGRRK